MPEKKDNRGGARSGSGRPPKKEGEVKEDTYTFRPSKEVKQILDKYENRTDRIEVSVVGREITKMIFQEIAGYLPITMQAVINSYDDTLTDGEILKLIIKRKYGRGD